jgi:hypothetical protein
METHRFIVVASKKWNYGTDNKWELCFYLSMDIGQSFRHVYGSHSGDNLSINNDGTITNDLCCTN